MVPLFAEFGSCWWAVLALLHRGAAAPRLAGASGPKTYLG